MHPARSLILFTALSGAGLGALVWLGLLAILGTLPRGAALAAGALALILLIAGLLCSTLHLRHPQRAWRALSQWRSSWLSREGVLALVTIAFACLLLAALWRQGPGAETVLVAGPLTAAAALATVYATAMIYRSLWTVPAWHNRWTVPAFLLIALASGGLMTAAAAMLREADLAGLRPLPEGTMAALLGAVALKHRARRSAGGTDGASDSAGAVGLAGRAVGVRLLEAPSTSQAWLEREMAFRVARRHARKLWRISAGLALAVAGPLLAGAWLLPGPAAAAMTVLAALAGLGAALVERWLFFAEARHKMTLYFGTERV